MSNKKIIGLLGMIGFFLGLKVGGIISSTGNYKKSKTLIILQFCFCTIFGTVGLPCLFIKMENQKD